MFKAEHIFRTLARSRASTIEVKLDVLMAVLEKITMQIDIRALIKKADGKVQISLAVVSEILEALQVHDMQEDLANNRNATYGKLHGANGAAPIWRRLKMLSPKGVGVLTHLIDKKWEN